MHRIRDLVQQTTTSEGNGALLLDGTVVGMFSFAGSGYVDGDTFPLTIAHETANEVEETLGTFHTGSPPYITRADTPFRSSTGSKIAFSVGRKTISVVSMAAPISRPFRPATGSSTTMDLTDYEIFVGTGAAHAVALPPILFKGQQCRVTVDNQVDVGVNEVTVTPASGTINGAANLPLRAPRMSVKFVAVSLTDWQTRP